MIEIDSFYIAAGLLPPSEWEIQRLAAFRHDVFNKIPDFIAEKDCVVPDFSRRSGKTTKIIIEALYAEWQGYNTALVCKSAVEQYFLKSRYDKLKKAILAKIGPPLVTGKSSVITTRTQKYYTGYKILLDLD